MAEPADLDRRARRKLEVRGAHPRGGARAVRRARLRRDQGRRDLRARRRRAQDLLQPLPVEAGPACAQIAQHAIERAARSTSRRRARRGASTRERLARFFARHGRRAALEAGPMFRELRDRARARGARVGHRAPSRRAGCTTRSARSSRDGLAAGDVTRRHDAETLTEMILGAYYVLIFNCANLDDFPLADQAAAVARFLGDALAASRRRSRRWRDAKTSTTRFRSRTAGSRSRGAATCTRATCGRSTTSAQELVLFRTRSGEARVLDAFCPHLGAHLGRRRPRDGRDDPLPVPRLAVRRHERRAACTSRTASASRRGAACARGRCRRRTAWSSSGTTPRPSRPTGTSR